MKKSIFLLSALTTLLFAFKSFKTSTYTVDTDKSAITWIGRKVTGEHNGTIKLASGLLVATENNLKSGNFKLDMNTITCADLSGEYGDKLLGHLKSEDFFSVEKNPYSTFTITKISKVASNTANITGDLTIKGIKNSITFPATISFSGNTVVAEAKKVLVDRTKYDIRYGSKSFFDKIGDKAIDDEFELSIKLVATKFK